jgi:hypothetical protein
MAAYLNKFGFIPWFSDRWGRWEHRAQACFRPCHPPSVVFDICARVHAVVRLRLRHTGRSVFAAHWLQSCGLLVVLGASMMGWWGAGSHPPSPARSPARLPMALGQPRSVVKVVSSMGLQWQAAFGIVVGLYFYSHYFFASGTGLRETRCSG